MSTRENICLIARTPLILCLYNVDTLNICMEEFGLTKIIFDKMTAMITKTIFPNITFVYA